MSINQKQELQWIKNPKPLFLVEGKWGFYLHAGFVIGGEEQ